jgi:hypothetical protein
MTNSNPTINGGALAGHRYRVIVSTDIGGTDPDDFQSMVHFLLYADIFDIEGIISTSGISGPGRKQDIFDVIACYEKDYDNLKKCSDKYPSPDALRVITKQGETEFVPYPGVQNATEGSEWIVKCARRDDPRPLYILGWGGIEDIAQALHDAPDILSKLRVYWVGGPNKKWGPHQYQYVVENHPELWIIEVNSTYRGWFVGGNQDDQWGNTEFVKQHVAGKGALGEYFNTKLEGTIKMGDTPSVGWLLRGTPEDPSLPSWGGNFVRAWERFYLLLNRLPTEADRMEEFGILELALPLGEEIPENPEAFLNVDNQSLPGYTLSDGTMRFRFSPKSARVFSFAISSNVPALNEKTGAITAYTPESDTALQPSARFPNWWTDDLARDVAEEHLGVHTVTGAKTVSQWREDYLRDFADRMDRCKG